MLYHLLLKSCKSNTAVTIGSGIAHGIILAADVTAPVLHGGVFLFTLQMILMWIVAWLTESFVTAPIVSVLKPKSPHDYQNKEEELSGYK